MPNEFRSDLWVCPMPVRSRASTQRAFRAQDIKEMFERATSEAKSAFGDGSLFIEKFI